MAEPTSRRAWRVIPVAAALAAASTLAACASSTAGHPAAVTTLNHTVTATATVTASAPAPDFSAFTHQWSGHTRSVDISPTGVMTEFVSSGCCDLALVVVLQLSNPSATSADATVLSVYSEDQTGPKQGATGTVSIAAGILTDSLDQVTYCDEAVPSAAGQCGA